MRGDEGEAGQVAGERMRVVAATTILIQVSSLSCTLAATIL